MDSATHSTVLQSASKNKVYAHQLLTAFNNYVSTIKVLSLDCFDTLLWRKTVSPSDVFQDLQSRPAFKEIGYNSFLRKIISHS